MANTTVVYQPGVAKLSDGCPVIYGEWLAPISVLIASSAVTQLLAVVATIASTPRRFAMLSLWFPRGSGFLNFCLILVQLVHFGFICWNVSRLDPVAYARFSGWDAYTLFVLRTTNCGLFSNAFTLAMGLLGDRHVAEGALNTYGARDYDNAYAILASAVHEVGAVRNDARAEAVAAVNLAAAAGLGPGAGVTVVETDDDTVEFVATAASPRAADAAEAATLASVVLQLPTESERLRAQPGGSRLLEWVHGAGRRADAPLPTKHEFVVYRGDAFTRAGRWLAGAIGLTLLPAFLTHLVPGLVVFALFIPGGLVAAAICGGVARVVFLRCLDPLAARAAAKVIARVAAAHTAAATAAAGASPSASETVVDARALPPPVQPQPQPRYPCVTPGLALYFCVRALVVGALGSVAQILFATLVHHAVITFSMPVPLRPSQYWGVTEEWWGLLDARCYAESLASAAAAATPDSAPAASQRAVAFASYFL